MKLTYTNNLPLIRIKVIGRGETEVNSHVDFASSKTVIPTKLAEELKLVFAGFDLTATGAGVVPMPTYRATVQLLGKSFGLLLGCLDLPEAVGITSLLGRDVLDAFKVCLDGKRKVIELSDT